MSQARYWLLTIPHHNFLPYLPDACSSIKGQLECGSTTGYLHWQVLVSFKRAVRLGAVKKLFGDSVHAEPSRSAAADEYVWKDDTAVENTRFDLGKKPLKRNSPKDWDSIREAAKQGRFDDIPSDVYIRSFGNLQKIYAHSMDPKPFEKHVKVFWGKTRTGKSRMAWEEAGFDAYPKDPNSKFWDGYRGQRNVVIDEFRGKIDISHILRWTDRYPTLADIKGSAVPLAISRIWITSNLDPRLWYPDLDQDTRDALLARFEIVHFNGGLGE